MDGFGLLLLSNIFYQRVDALFVYRIFLHHPRVTPRPFAQSSKKRPSWSASKRQQRKIPNTRGNGGAYEKPLSRTYHIIRKALNWTYHIRKLSLDSIAVRRKASGVIVRLCTDVRGGGCWIRVYFLSFVWSFWLFDSWLAPLRQCFSLRFPSFYWLAWALFVLLLSTLVCCQPTELIWVVS